MCGRLIVLMLLPLVICGTALANGLQAQCGVQSGRGFAAEGGVVNEANAGWYDDTMQGETIVRIDTDTGAVDVRFRDATGIWQAVSDQGGSATLFTAQPAAFVVIVVYPGNTIEVLTIAEIVGNRGTLIHTLSRATDRIVNARVMTASCLITAH